MREQATSDRSLEAKRVWEEYQAEKRRHVRTTTKPQANQAAVKSATAGSTVSLDLAKAKTKLAEATLLQ